MILVSFGTRPEYIKLKPLMAEMKEEIPFKVLFTGQHTDLLAHIDGPIARLKIEDGVNRLDSIVSSMMNRDDIFEGIQAVIVQGDTTSAFAVALAAFHRKIKVIHLEAGLRTFNKYHPYPEEFNRRAISSLADIHLAPTEISAGNLQKENVDGKIFTVGNTVLDNLTHYFPVYTYRIVITMHRRENHHLIPQWFEKFDKLARENPKFEFVLPIHPNPNVYRHKDLLKHVKVVPAMPYAEFLPLMASAFMVITDSGGIQEESSFFRKKSLVCRQKTERVEGMGEFAYMTDLDNIEENFYNVMRDHIPKAECPYGDGTASQQIVEILLEELHGE
mgnify:FL=1